MKALFVTLIQSDISWENKAQNTAAFSEKIRGLPKSSQIVFLPEMFATGFSMNPQLAESMDGEIISWLRREAQATGKILCGSVMIKEEAAIFNRLIWMLPNGEFHYYDKRHLFAFGGEDKVFSSGNKRLIVQVNGWKLCLLICYDLRFPVWCRQKSPLYDALIFIANWPAKRSDIWECLLKARAIENQSFVIGLNRIGKDGSGLNHSGDSQIINPLGKIVQEAPSNKQSIIHYELDPREIQTTREHFPFLNDADGFILHELAKG